MIVYTAIVGGVDDLRSDIMCFIKYDKFKHNVRNAKIYKVLSHLFLDADVSMWVDGNIFLIKPPEFYLQYLDSSADIALFEHPLRSCLYQEAEPAKERCGMLKEVCTDVDEQISHYKAAGVSEKLGLYECGVLIRRHNKRVERFNNAWWAEICRYSERDQISFMKVLQEYPLEICVIDGEVRNHEYFIYKGH